ncbi:MAG: c-type cytochrome [Gammaproteobacteria bacterium]|nr:c-type cytochrome [Gammaproteobacteria bacterium]
MMIFNMRITNRFQFVLAAAIGIAALTGNGLALAADTPSSPKPETTAELVEQGKTIYFTRCSFCHGLLGDGNGPAADYLDPRPRDFTLGTFKFRTTQSGELPTDEDMFRTVSRGLSGTGMQAFDSDLIMKWFSEEERWAVIFYIKTFVPEFEDPELDPYLYVIEMPSDMPPYSEALVAKGKEVFKKAKCWECHGESGRGNGQEAFDRTDDWGFPIRIRNVTLPWKIKAGGEPIDIFTRFSTGINGTPMPSFIEGIPEASDRWALANFIKSLQHQVTSHRVLKALRVEGPLPDDSSSEVWAQAETMDVRLTGQVVAAPRWQNPSIELVITQAVYNDEEIAFLLQWDDPFKDVIHDEEAEFDPADIGKVGAYNSYVNPNETVTRQLKTFRDSIAMQFPVKPLTGTRRPHFFRGDSSNPVNLWIWKSDLADQGQLAGEEANARGWKQPPRIQDEDQQQVVTSALWDNGRWHVVMKRKRLTDGRGDVQFNQGQFIPLALNAWDGSNGEHGRVMSLSSWYNVLLEAPTPVTVYIYTILAILITGVLGVWAAKKAREDGDTEQKGEDETFV